MAMCAEAVYAEEDLTDEAAPSEMLRLPPTVAVAMRHQAELLPQTTTDGRVFRLFTLNDFESLALTSHPVIAEGVAKIAAAKCECLQVGLPPNPTVAYVGSEIGNEGQAGQQGIAVGQQFVRGGKLKLNRAVIARKILKLEQELAITRHRVLTDIRTAFYDVYISQEQVELTQQLAKQSRQAVETVEQLIEAREGRRIDLLQAEIESRQIAAQLKQAEAAQQAAWRKLAATAGRPNWGLQIVDANPDSLSWELDWQASRESLLTASPEVAAAMAEVARAKAVWCRAKAEPISDVTAQVSLQYDDATEDTIAGVQVGMPLPLWNRNQGGIGQARRLVTAAQRRLEAVELRLSRQLAEQVLRYETAQAEADAYREGILERAEENLKLVSQAYAAGEVSFLDLLTVQRTYFRSSLDYLDNLRSVNQSVQLLEGLLLNNAAQ